MTKTYREAHYKLERAAFKKGQFAGQAVVGSRHKTHRRFIRYSDDLIVARMYSTDVFKLYSDGKIVINSGGWHDNPTTREFMNEVMPVMFRGVKYKDNTTFSVLTTQGWTPYYTNMVLQEDDLGRLTLVTEPDTYSYTRVDKEATKKRREIFQPALDMALLLEAANVPFEKSVWGRTFHEFQHVDQLTAEDAESLAWWMYRKGLNAKGIRAAFNEGTQVRVQVDGPTFL